MDTIRQITELLLNLGFSETEARVYLTLLEKGEASPSDIAKTSGVKRPTAYAAIERLAEKGLVIRGQDARGREIDRATTPDLLVDLIKKKQSELKELSSTLSAFIASHFRIPKVSLHFGIEGLKKVHNEGLKSSTDHLVWGVLSSKKGTKLTDWYPEYGSLRVKQGICSKIIMPKAPGVKQYQADDEKEGRRTFVLRDTDVSFDNEIVVFDNKAAFINHEKTVMALIEDEGTANTLRAIFKLCLAQTEAPVKTSR